MSDEASGSSDHLPSNLTDEFSGTVDSDDNTSQSQPQNADRPSVPAHLFNLSAMGDRRGRAERSCSNIPTAQARNRHRDRNAPSAGRHRAPTNGSANQRPAAESDMMQDDACDARCDTGDVTVVVASDLTLLPILQTDFVQSSDKSSHNWQVCCSTSHYCYSKFVKIYC